MKDSRPHDAAYGCNYISFVLAWRVVGLCVDADWYTIKFPLGNVYKLYQMLQFEFIMNNCYSVSSLITGIICFHIHLYKHLIPPLDKHLIRPKSLRTLTLPQLRRKPRPIRQQPGMRNHDAIINTEPLVCRKHAPAPLPRHLPHHLL